MRDGELVGAGTAGEGIGGEGGGVDGGGGKGGVEPVGAVGADCGEG